MEDSDRHYPQKRVNKNNKVVSDEVLFQKFLKIRTGNNKVCKKKRMLQKCNILFFLLFTLVGPTGLEPVTP